MAANLMSPTYRNVFVGKSDQPASSRQCYICQGISSPGPFKTLESALTPATENSYPNVRRCLLVLQCIQVSTATEERYFSTMRRHHGNRAHVRSCPVEYTPRAIDGSGRGHQPTDQQTNQPTNQQTGQKQYVPHYYSGGHKNVY
ncbi:hypothetical protein DPMN_089925 [Dreissena polymorpha]|uniref:HAT C-terminal dimerisation domain-containing protein n=1 Tax=Dreissena polymorpha TaxID=45954 RepID=A0A9D4KWT7_DREPO|nr:hypothetical protein DPMN_089925 [Dreissena polymorpha]